MNHQLDNLLMQRGRLLERIASQRDVLRNDFAPVEAALSRADSAVAGVHSFVDYIRRHPAITSVALAGVLIFKGKTMWRWAKRAFSLWQTWRMVQATLQDLGGRVRL